MNYLDRFLAKNVDIPLGVTDKTDKTTAENLAIPLGNYRQDRQDPPHVSLVSKSEEESPDFTPARLVPASWRDCLAGWPDEWREKWGRLANALEDEGQVFPRSEFEAFTRVKKEMDGS